MDVVLVRPNPEESAIFTVLKRFSPVLLVLAAVITSSCATEHREAPVVSDKEPSEKTKEAAQQVEESKQPAAGQLTDESADESSAAEEVAANTKQSMREAVVASGSGGGHRWTLYASIKSGEHCHRIWVESPGGAGGGGGCNHKLPIDTSESCGSSGVRLIYGSVTLDAASVLVNTSEGKSLDLAPKGAEAGFGRAFFLARIDVDVRIKDVVAYDADGRELGRKSEDQKVQELMVKCGSDRD